MPLLFANASPRCTENQIKCHSVVTVHENGDPYPLVSVYTSDQKIKHISFSELQGHHYIASLWF